LEFDLGCTSGRWQAKDVRASRRDKPKPVLADRLDMARASYQQDSVTTQREVPTNRATNRTRAVHDEAHRSHLSSLTLLDWTDGLT
jgi:hypothetical protein